MDIRILTYKDLNREVVVTNYNGTSYIGRLTGFDTFYIMVQNIEDGSVKKAVDAGTVEFNSNFDKYNKVKATDRLEDILDVFWAMLQFHEGECDKRDVIKKLLVESGYNILNDIEFTRHRPRWEKKQEK